MKTQIYVDNLKCDGCATTVTRGLKQFSGVSMVRVDLENGLVEVEHNNSFSQEEAKAKLLHLGYPEKGTLVGIGKIATHVKSYASCALGKLTKE